MIRKLRSIWILFNFFYCFIILLHLIFSFHLPDLIFVRSMGISFYWIYWLYYFIIINTYCNLVNFFSKCIVNLASCFLWILYDFSEDYPHQVYLFLVGLFYLFNSQIKFFLYNVYNLQFNLPFYDKPFCNFCFFIIIVIVCEITIHFWSQ